jgi:hypothetical protein
MTLHLAQRGFTDARTFISSYLLAIEEIWGQPQNPGQGEPYQPLLLAIEERIGNAPNPPAAIILPTHYLICLSLSTIRPLVRSYGESATATLSPGIRRTGLIRSLSSRRAVTIWPLSSCTRHVPFGAGSNTLPSTLVSPFCSVNVRIVLLIDYCLSLCTAQASTLDKQ